MTKEELLNLKEGDIVTNLGSGLAYIVTIPPTHYPQEAIGVRTIHISNPSEWEVFAKATIVKG